MSSREVITPHVPKPARVRATAELMGPGLALTALLPQSLSHTPISWHPPKPATKEEDQTHSRWAAGSLSPFGIQGRYGPSPSAGIEAGWKLGKGSLALVGGGEEKEGSQNLSRIPLHPPSWPGCRGLAGEPMYWRTGQPDRCVPHLSVQLSR